MQYNKFKINTEIANNLVYKFILTLAFAVSLFFTSLSIVNAAPNTDNCDAGIFPELVICGRSVNSSCATPVNTKPCELKDLPIVFGNVIEFAIVFVLLLIPIYIMYIGILLILKQGESKELSNLKNKIYKSIGFFILIFAGWLIIKTLTGAFGVSEDVPSFLLDKNGSVIENSGNSVN